MQMSKKTLLLLLGLVTVLAVVALACGSEDPTATSPAMAEDTPTAVMEDTSPFRIGVMESVTGPGETYGVMAVQAKEMAVDEINAAGGINGRMLEIIVEDEKCNAQDSITAYRKLTQVDGVKIILGTSCSGAMLGAAPLAEEDGVVMFSGLATNPRHRRRRGLHFQDLFERCLCRH